MDKQGIPVPCPGFEGDAFWIDTRQLRDRDLLGQLELAVERSACRISHPVRRSFENATARTHRRYEQGRVPDAETFRQSWRGPAGAMQERGHVNALDHETVVGLDRHGGLLADHGDVVRFEKRKGRLVGLQPQLSPSAENDNPRIMFEQFFNIGRLNAGPVVHARLGPVPLTPATWPKLGITTVTDVVDLEMTPAVVADVGRSFIAVHDLSLQTRCVRSWPRPPRSCSPLSRSSRTTGSRQGTRQPWWDRQRARQCSVVRSSREQRALFHVGPVPAREAHAVTDRREEIAIRKEGRLEAEERVARRDPRRGPGDTRPDDLVHTGRLVVCPTQHFDRVPFPA